MSSMLLGLVAAASISSASASTFAIDSANEAAGVLCTQVYGVLYNPDTKECRIYRDGCEQGDLRSAGFTQDSDEASCGF